MAMHTLGSMPGRVGADSVRGEDYPPSGARYDGLFALLSAALVGGAYLASWASNHNVADDSPLSPWRAVLYAGVVLVAGFLALSAARNRARGYPWRRALPRGYDVAALGVLVTLLGLVVAVPWQVFIGAGNGLETLVGPPVLLAALGALLIVAAPLHAA